MSDITIIGLGIMGDALARAIQGSSNSLTVWNRSPARMQPFIDDGVAASPDVASAIKASPMILICVDSNPVSDALLNTDEVRPHLTGRTIIQLSTCTPREASDSDAWMRAQGAFYVDGAIQCGPDQIGTAAADMLLSGDEAGYQRASALLECLGGTMRYLGKNVRAAAIVHLAAVCEAYSRFMAITHAACMCEAEGISLDVLATMFPDDSFSRRYANIIHASDYENPAAPLRVWEAAAQNIRTQANEVGINTDFPDYVANLFEKAMDAGYGEEHVMALVKVLRKA